MVLESRGFPSRCGMFVSLVLENKQVVAFVFSVTSLRLTRPYIRSDLHDISDLFVEENPCLVDLRLSGQDVSSQFLTHFVCKQSISAENDSSLEDPGSSVVLQ